MAVEKDGERDRLQRSGRACDKARTKAQDRGVEGQRGPWLGEEAEAQREVGQRGYVCQVQAAEVLLECCTNVSLSDVVCSKPDVRFGVRMIKSVRSMENRLS